MDHHVVDRKTVITKFQVLKKNKEGRYPETSETNCLPSPSQQQNTSGFEDQPSQNWNHYNSRAVGTPIPQQQSQYVNVPVATENYPQNFYPQQGAQAQVQHQYQDYYYVDNTQYQDAAYPPNYTVDPQSPAYGEEVVYVDENGCYYDYDHNGYYQTQVGYPQAHDTAYNTGYDTAYNAYNAYNTGYDGAYNTGYDVAYNTGYDGAYNAGYQQKYPQAYGYANANAENVRKISVSSQFSEIDSEAQYYPGAVGQRVNSGVVSAYNVRSQNLESLERPDSPVEHLTQKGSQIAKSRSTDDSPQRHQRIIAGSKVEHVASMKEKPVGFSPLTYAPKMRRSHVPHFLSEKESAPGSPILS